MLAKVLANRLRTIMGSVISEAQSAFILGRQIFDWILIANKLVDDARRLKKEMLLFKVDFEEAFDSVNWLYFDAIMTKINFLTLWRKWIMECVSIVSASILVNDWPKDEFKLERGLQQGNHFSAFLFLIVVEGINVMMNALVEE